MQEWEMYDREIAAKNSAIFKLTEELKKLKTETVLNAKYERAASEAEGDTLARLRRQRLDTLKKGMVWYGVNNSSVCVRV